MLTKLSELTKSYQLKNCNNHGRKSASGVLLCDWQRHHWKIILCQTMAIKFLKSFWIVCFVSCFSVGFFCLVGFLWLVGLVFRGESKWLYILLKIGIARIKVCFLACAAHFIHFILEKIGQVPPKWAVATIWKWSYGRGWRRGTGCNETSRNMVA